jgi:hypothetical protein
LEGNGGGIGLGYEREGRKRGWKWRQAGRKEGRKGKRSHHSSSSSSSSWSIWWLYVSHAIIDQSLGEREAHFAPVTK